MLEEVEVDGSAFWFFCRLSYVKKGEALRELGTPRRGSLLPLEVEVEVEVRRLVVASKKEA